MAVWTLFALASAVGAAANGLALKRALEHGGVLVSSIAFRLVAGGVLLAVATSLHGRVTPTPAYWRMLALVTPLEAAGLACMTMALRAGDLSLVHPILGLFAPLVMAMAVVVLGEVPSATAILGVLLVSAGVYALGLGERASLLAPLRALARERAAWLALGAAVFWAGTTVLHKFGIREVGPYVWGASLMLSSAVALALVLPVARWRTGAVGAPARWRPWLAWTVATGLLFTIESAGFFLGLERGLAGYVSGVKGSAALWGVLFGVVLLRERSAVGPRLIGGAMITLGVALIGFLG